MTNAERVATAQEYVSAAIWEIGDLREHGTMTQDVYSMVREWLDDAMYSLYDSSETGIRSEKKKRLRQHAVFALAEAYSTMKKTNPDTPPRLKIAEAMRSLVA